MLLAAGHERIARHVKAQRRQQFEAAARAGHCDVQQAEVLRRMMPLFPEVELYAGDVGNAVDPEGERVGSTFESSDTTSM